MLLRETAASQGRTDVSAKQVHFWNSSKVEEREHYQQGLGNMRRLAVAAETARCASYAPPVSPPIA